MNRVVLNGLVLLILYWAFAVLGLQWARYGGAGSAVWPAFGISIAGLVLGGPRLWPAIFLGRLLASYTVGAVQPLWADLAIAAANAGSDLLGAVILLRVARIDVGLRSRRDLLWLTGAVSLSAALSATLGGGAVILARDLGSTAAFHVWTGWFLGNLVSGLTLVPLILSWGQRGPWSLTRGGWAHFALCMASVGALSWLIFGGTVPWLRSWHLFPVLIWAAVAFYVRGASLALVIASGLALWGVTSGGPLVIPGLDPVLTTQQFVSLAAVTILLLATISNERRGAEAAARLAAIASSSPDAMIGCDREGRLTSWNDGAERLFGWSEAEAVGKHFSLLAPDPQAIDGQRELLDRMIEGERVDLETVRRAKSGELIDVHYVGTNLRDGAGEVTGALVVIRDIRERKAAEAALREESETLEILNRSGAALAAELDLDRIVQSVTDAGREVTGAQFGAFFYNVYDPGMGSYMLYTLSGAERSQFEDFGMPRATSVFAPTFKGEGIIRSDDITQDARYGHNSPNKGMPEGHLPVRSYLAVPVISRTGEVLGGLFFGHSDVGVFSARSERILTGLAAQAAIAIDNSRLFREAQDEIAERRRAEGALRDLNDTLEQRVEERTRELVAAQDQLRQAQKMEAIGQLTGGVAHDFNNLLTIIRSSVDMLQRAELPEARRGRYLAAISETADRAAKLTAQLLAFARRQALKPEVFDAAERIRLVCDMVRTVVGSRIELALDIECADCFIEADIAQFETALVNVAVNARDAMDGEGRLSVSARAVRGVPGDEARAQADYVAIAISDTGRGIPPEATAQIFEPFFTTKEVGKGTGLGLSQVYGFVKQSGGEVKVESELGRGTTFALYLPKVSAPTGKAAAADGPVSIESSEPSCILVVEDNPEVRDFATQLLGELGHVTREAGNADEALAVLEGDAGSIDLVFTDVVMPGRSGIELAQEIRRRWPALRVVLTSGYSHVLAQEGRHGFELLQKPYSLEGLLRVVRRAPADAPAS